jgi:hypothetical protein
LSLREKGLIELTDADARIVHYRIHRVAWAYMQKHPNKFQNLVGWSNEPWAFQEDEVRDFLVRSIALGRR